MTSTSRSSGERPYRVLLAISASVAAIKINELIAGLSQAGEEGRRRTEVRVILTENSKHFLRVQFPSGGTPNQSKSDFVARLDRASLNATTGEQTAITQTPEASWWYVGNPSPSAVVVEASSFCVGDLDCGGDTSTTYVYDDSCEYRAWQGRGDSVLHIDLKDWADVLVIAPMSANTLAKVANGQCDNLLTCVLRAWPCRGSWAQPVPSPATAWTHPHASKDANGSTASLLKPIIVAPAMNTNMLYHPATRAHMNTLNTWYNQPHGAGHCPQLFVASTVRKVLACGVEGLGAMAESQAIMQVTRDALEYHYSPTMKGEPKAQIEARNISAFASCGATV